MALTQIADIIEPSVFEPYVRLRTAELSALWEGDIVRTDPRLDALVSGAGTSFNMPFWDDLTDTESTVGSDDNGSSLTPDKIGTGQDIAIKHFRNHAWSSADILSDFVGQDPMEVIADLVASYWARQWQSMLISSLTGVLLDNANDSDDMLYSVATDDAAPVTEAEKISADAVLQAAQTAGDASGMFRTLSMHSVLATELKRQNLIDFIPNARGEVQFGRYLDKLVIIDDGHPAVAGSERVTYTTYLYRPGAFGFGRGEPKRPVAVKREELQGDGSGVESLVSRQVVGLHPRGFAWQEGSMAGESPTNAELALAANWDRVYNERKQVGLAFLQTNG